MRTTGSMWAVAAVLALGVAVLPACKTDQPGVKSTYRSQYGNVEGSTQEATEAAEAVLNELGLQDVEAASTKLDGEAIGYTADRTKVTVSVQRITDETSQVSVYVGRVGDPTLGTDIFARIQDRLNE